MPKGSGGGEQGHNFWDLALNGLDDTVTPAIVSFGNLGVDTGGNYRRLRVSASGAISNDDAGNFRVSTLGGTGLSANQSISAVLLGGTAFVGDVSALSPDASLFRVSSIGGTAGDRTLVDGTTQTISATLTPISAKPAGSVAGLVTNTFQADASQFRTSAILAAGVSSAGAQNFSVSAVAGDAGTLRVSAIGGDANTLHTSAVQGDAGLQRVSAILAAGLSSAGAQNFIVSGVVGDAGTFRVSALNQDANFMHVSGFSPDAGLFRVSAINSISALSPDAGLFRVSSQAFDYTTSAFMTAIGNSLSISAFGNTTIGAQLSGTWTGTIAFQATVDESNWFAWQGVDNGTNQIVSSTTTSRNLTFNVAGLRRFRLSATAAMTGTLSAFMDATLGHDEVFVALKQDDAAYARLSAIIDNGSVSAKSALAAQFLVSASQGSADQLRVSAILAAGVSSVGAASFGVSAAQIDAGVFHASAFSGDGNQLHVSAVQGDSGLLRVSAILQAGVSSSGAANFGVSAAQTDAGALHSSAFSGDANQVHTSAVQGDAGLQHVSASIFPDTTGGLTTFSNFNVSTSQTIKSSGGAVYGWYAWNDDAKPNFINLYNTSGAINVGVDTIQVQIYLAASAAANMVFPIGLKGFTNGIGVASVSAAVSTANTPGAASSVGLNLFYK